MSDVAAIPLALPVCGLQCLAAAVTSLSNCSLTDSACTCADPGVQDAAAKCVLETCSVSDALKTKNSTLTTCGIKTEPDFSYVPVVYTFLGIAIGFVILRFVTRLRQGLKLWWDDWFAALAAVPLIATAVLIEECQRLGVGLPIWAVPQENISQIMIYFWVFMFLYTASRVATRVSISLFMLRIFTTPSCRPFIIATIVMNLVINTTYFFIILFFCTPTSYFWNSWDGLHEGHCIDEGPMFVAGPTIAIILDVVLATLPVYWVFQLQFSLAKKITTASMFLVGVLIIIVSALRTWKLVAVAHSENVTGSLPGVVTFSWLEMTLAIILCCIPSLRLLVAPWLTSLWGWTTRRRAYEVGSHDKNIGTGDEWMVVTIGGSGEKAPGSKKAIAINKTTTIQQRRRSLSLIERDTADLDLHEGRGTVQGHAWAGSVRI